MKLKSKQRKLYKSFNIFLLIVTLAVIGWLAYFRSENKNIFNTVIKAEKNKKLDPREPLVLNFSSKFLQANYRNKIKVEPPINFREEFEGSKLLIYPEDSWPLGENVIVYLPQGKNIFFLPIQKKEYSFSILDYPKISRIFPWPDSKDIIIDIEDPIEIIFQDSTLGFYLSFETEPARRLIIESDEEKRIFKVLPEENFPQGEEVKLKIFSRYAQIDNKEYEKIYQGSFTTLPRYPDQWSKDLAQRIEEAKRFTQAKIKEGKYIDVNLTAQVLSIFENGKRLGSFLVSSGKRGFDTPRGEFQIYNKYPRPWSRAFSLFMPYWMAITSSGKYGIHELPEWPGGYKEGANHLGVPVSHGCIRLGVDSAQKVYNWSEIGTKVVIY